MSGSDRRKAIRKGFLPATKRNLLPAECAQLMEMNRAINTRRWEIAEIKGNTALVPNGQELVKQLEAVCNLLETSCLSITQTLLFKCGYPAGTKCDLNLSTGEIKVHEA